MKHEGDCDTNWVGAVGTMPKGLVKEVEVLEIRGQVETIQTTESRSAGILRRVLESWVDLQSLNLKWYEKIIIIVTSTQILGNIGSGTIKYAEMKEKLK